MLATSNLGHILKRGVSYDPLGTFNEPDINATKLIGQTFQFVDHNLLSSELDGNKPVRNGESVTCMFCKNNSGVVLPAKRIITINPDIPGSATGLAAIGDSDDWCAVVDEYLPADVPVNGLFLAVVRGRTLCRTSAAVSGTSITAGMYCQAATGGFINGSGTLVTLAGGVIDSAAVRMIRNTRFEARTAYTGGAAAADIVTWVHGR